MNDVVIKNSGAPKPDNIGQDLLQVPFPEMVKAIAVGIAEAQLALDMTSLKIAQLMSGAAFETNGQGDGKTTTVSSSSRNLVEFGGNKYSLLELGFTPTFYQFVDTIIEIKMSISMSREKSDTRSTFDLFSQVGYEASMGFMGARATASLNVSTVSASFASKYQYSAEGSSLMRTKLVPVPPPAILEERIRLLLVEGAQKRDPTSAATI